MPILGPREFQHPDPPLAILGHIVHAGPAVGQRPRPYLPAPRIELHEPARHAAIDRPPVALLVDRDLHDDPDTRDAARLALGIIRRRRTRLWRLFLLVGDHVVLDVLRLAELRLVERHLLHRLDRTRLLVETEILRQVLEDVLAILQPEAEAAGIAGEHAFTQTDSIVIGERLAHHFVEAELPPPRAARVQGEVVLAMTVHAEILEHDPARARRIDLLVTGQCDLLGRREDSVTRARQRWIHRGRVLIRILGVVHRHLHIEVVAPFHDEWALVRFEASRHDADLIVAREHPDSFERSPVRVDHVQHVSPLVSAAEVDLRRLERFGRRHGSGDDPRPVQLAFLLRNDNGGMPA